MSIVITKSMVEDILFVSAVKVFEEHGNWPALVMMIYKRAIPEMDHHAEWDGDYLHVTHRFLDRLQSWKLLRDVCCPEEIRKMVEQSLDKMFEEDMKVELRCKVCGRKPEEIEEYVEMVESQPEHYDSPDDFVLLEEGTLNRETGQFYCTACYIQAGMPLGTA